MWSGCLASSPCPCRYRPALPGKGFPSLCCWRLNLTVLLIESRLRAPLFSTCSKQNKIRACERLLDSTRGPVCQTGLPTPLPPDFSLLTTPPPSSQQLIMVQRLFLFSTHRCPRSYLTQRSPLQRFSQSRDVPELVVYQERPCAG